MWIICLALFLFFFCASLTIPRGFVRLCVFQKRFIFLCCICLCWEKNVVSIRRGYVCAACKYFLCHFFRIENNRTSVRMLSVACTHWLVVWLLVFCVLVSDLWQQKQMNWNGISFRNLAMAYAEDSENNNNVLTRQKKLQSENFKRNFNFNLKIGFNEQSWKLVFN